MARSAILLLLFLLLAGCGGTDPAVYQGYVEGEYLQLAAPVGGRLERLAVARGDEVAAGAVLFQLEPDPERAALAEAEQQLARSRAQLADLLKGERDEELAVIRAQIEQARAQLVLSEKQLQRQQELRTRNLGSTAAVDEAYSQRDRDAARLEELEARLRTAELAARSDAIHAAEAAVKAAEAAVAQERWRLAQKTVPAPQAGLVADTLYREGEWVAAGAPVVSLLPPENRKLRFFVPETVVGALEPGMAVTARCDGCPAPIPATIGFIAPRAEYTPPVIYSRENRARLVFLVEARPAPADAERLQPGQPVDVELAP